MLDPLWATVAGIALLTAVGRIALSLLPPGALGSHRPGSLVLTWSVSYLLGSVLVAAQATFVFGTPEALNWVPLFLPWLILLGLRLLTLPGALVPRHEPSEPGWHNAQRLLAIAIGAGCLSLVFLVASGGITPRLPKLSSHGPNPPDSFFFVSGVSRDLLRRLGVETDEKAVGLALAFSALAWIACFAHALAQARRTRSWRLAATLLVFVLTLAAFNDAQLFYGIGVLFLLGAGACFIVPWLRRGDRRSLAIATILLAGAGLESRVPTFALTALLPLVAVTAPNSRRSAAWWSTVAFVLLCVIPWGVVYRDAGILDRSNAAILGLPILCAALPVPFLLLWVRRDPRREVVALAGASLTLLGPIVGLGFASGWTMFHPLFLSVVIPSLLVLLGVGLLPQIQKRH